jgi:hypothetical protein
MFNWLKDYNRRKQLQQDHKLLEVRARRLLKNYLSADGPRKQRYYEVVAGAAAACQPTVSDPGLSNTKLAHDTAEAALKVVRHRELQKMDGDELQSMITDAYATVAVAYRRAGVIDRADPELLRLGTAAVHLVTMATSYIDKDVGSNHKS